MISGYGVRSKENGVLQADFRPFYATMIETVESKKFYERYERTAEKKR